MFSEPLPVRCPECDKLLFKTISFFGFTIVEIKCLRCDAVVRWSGFAEAEVLVHGDPRKRKNVLAPLARI